MKLHNVFRVLLMALSRNITEQQVIFVMENKMFVTVLQNVPQNKLYLWKLFENVVYEKKKFCMLTFDDSICLFQTRNVQESAKFTSISLRGRRDCWLDPVHYRQPGNSPAPARSRPTPRYW